MNHVYQDVWRAFKRVERSLDVIMDLDSNTFTPPRTTNANEPTLDTGEMQIWHDANSNTVYLVYNDANGGQVKTSLS